MVSDPDHRYIPLAGVFSTKLEQTMVQMCSPACQIASDAPVGTKILGTDGLFVPMVLSAGQNTLELDFHGGNVVTK